MTPPKERTPIERNPVNSSRSVRGGATSNYFSKTFLRRHSTLEGMRWFFRIGFVGLLSLGSFFVNAQPLPIFDAHLHYSHDAWDLVPVSEAIAILKKSGLKRALISSANDEGQQRLFAAAPDIVIPELRPYRTRADVGTWARDESVIPYL